jgi:hypothetical protein
VAVNKRLRLDIKPSRVAEYAKASQSLLRFADHAATRIEFLAGACRTILEYSGCDALELSLHLAGVQYRWEEAMNPDSISRAAVSAKTCGGRRGRASSAGPRKAYGGHESIATLHFKANQSGSGEIRLKSLRRKFFTRPKLEFCRAMVETLGLAVTNQKAHWALRDRVKEPTCLYALGKVAQVSGLALDDALQKIVELLPPAWQFPEIACARILIDGRVYATPGFRETAHCQAANLIVAGKGRGQIEVFYTGDRPDFVAEPFLSEEQSLIDTIAREVGLIVERRENADYQSARCSRN